MSERGVVMERRAAFARGRLQLVVRDADGAILAERRARNLVLQAGAEIVASLFAGADGARPVDNVMVGFGVDGADVGATTLTPPADDSIHESELRSPVMKDDFAVVTDPDSRTVRVSVATIFHPTVELADVTEAGLLAGDRLYNQVVFEPVTLRPGQDVTFFWEIDFPFGH
jgi:hypothetical protein